MALGYKGYKSMEKYNREEFEEVIVDIGRVTKVVKGGRRFRFTALVIVGNRKGLVGVGYGKAKEVPDAIRKAVDDAFKNIVEVKTKGSTIAHDVEVKYNASRIYLNQLAKVQELSQVVLHALSWNLQVLKTS